nr:MAG TPA: hypothetical protein [Caudoviricetes sp.]
MPHERPSFCGYRTRTHRRERQRTSNERQKILVKPCLNLIKA